MSAACLFVGPTALPPPICLLNQSTGTPFLPQEHPGSAHPLP